MATRRRSSPYWTRCSVYPRTTVPVSTGPGTVPPCSINRSTTSPSAIPHTSVPPRSDPPRSVPYSSIPYSSIPSIGNASIGIASTCITSASTPYCVTPSADIPPSSASSSTITARMSPCRPAPCCTVCGVPPPSRSMSRSRRSVATQGQAYYPRRSKSTGRPTDSQYHPARAPALVRVRPASVSVGSCPSSAPSNTASRQRTVVSKSVVRGMSSA